MTQTLNFILLITSVAHDVDISSFFDEQLRNGVKF